MRSQGDGGDVGDGKEPVSEEQLREWLRSGDFDLILLALAELARRYPEKITEWLDCKFDGQLTPTEIMEILDATADAVILMALRNGIKSKSVGRLSTLLYTIAKNKAIDLLRARGRWQIVDGLELDELMGNHIDASLELHELLEGIRDCISRFGSSMRQLFEIYFDMFLASGYPPSITELTNEYNRITGCNNSESTIRRRINRGLPRLGKCLASRGLL